MCSYVFYIYLMVKGTKGFESLEKDRPQFQGFGLEPLKRAFVNNRRETWYPESRRNLIVAGNFIIVLFAVLLDCSLFGAIFYAEMVVYTQYPQYEFPYFSWAVALFIAITIEVCSELYTHFSSMLTDLENHRTQTEYEDALVLKTLVFKIPNHFVALLVTVYIKKNSSLLGRCQESCIDDVKQQLWAIFIVRFILNIYQIVLPAMKYYGWFGSNIGSKTPSPDGDEEEAEKLDAEPDDNLGFLQDVDKDDYEGTFQDYAEAVIQFGYVNMFSGVAVYWDYSGSGERNED